MKQKFQHIAALFMMLIFLSYAVGIEVSQHNCKTHGTQSIALFGMSECQCEHQDDEPHDIQVKAKSNCCEQEDSTDESENSCCSKENTLANEANPSKADSNCCNNTKHEHNANNPIFSDDCCVELHHSFSIEDSYAVSIIEKPNPCLSVLYSLPIESNTYKSIIKSTNILNLARDVVIQNRQSIIQFLHNNSNPNKSDDLSISLA